MRIKYKNLIVECDLAFRDKRCIMFVTKSGVVLSALFMSEKLASGALSRAFRDGCLVAPILSIDGDIDNKNPSDFLLKDVLDNTKCEVDYFIQGLPIIKC